MDGKTVKIKGREFTVLWNRRAAFRMSEMGHESYDPSRDSAWASAWVASMLNADRERQPLTAYQVYEALADMDDEEKAALFDTVREEFERAKKPT